MAGCALELGLAIAGCGGSASKSQPATQPRSATPPRPAARTAPTEHVPLVDIVIPSPAFLQGKPISVRYTCDGAGVSRPLRWSAAPKGTAKLVLFIVGLEEAVPGGGKLIAWAVASLKPTLRARPAGILPAGAVVGRNSLGQARYTVCPAKGASARHHLVALYALAHPVAAKTGFAAGTLAMTVSKTTEYKGLGEFTYSRA